MGKLDNFDFISKDQLKQVMLANADKVDKIYLKKADFDEESFVKKTDIGNLASKDEVSLEDLDAVLAATIDSKANIADIITQENVDDSISAAMGTLGDLATLDKVAEEDLADGLKNKINDVYTKAEVYTKEEVFTKDETTAAINAKVASAYKIAGNIAFEDLPEATEETVGYVYNVTNAFTPDDRFVEAGGNEVAANTNVVVVSPEDGVYKYDVFAGFIDTSIFVKEEDVKLATSAQIQDIIDSIFAGIDTNPDPEVVDVVLTSENSLGEIANMFTEGVTTVNAKLGKDVTVPAREDGKITTTFVQDGQTVNLDLNGHTIDCQAYAFYVNGGELVIDDTTGTGKITTNLKKTYAAVQNNGGKVTMNGGVIDTRINGESQGIEGENWMYGVVCSGDGIFEMNGGEIHTDAASCISITNGTSGGVGAQFIIGGNAKLITDASATIYLADNKSVIVKDEAQVLGGGIMARMGTVEVKDNAKVVNSLTDFDDYGVFLVSSGTCAVPTAILGLAGCYKTTSGANDMNISVSDNAIVSSEAGNAILIDRLDTLYDQIVTVNVEDSSNLTAGDGFDKVAVREHDELAEIAAASGRTMRAKSVDSDVTVTVDGTVIYDNIQD